MQHAGEGHGGEDTGSQRAVGVNGRAVLGIAVVRNGRVKTGPVHPQVQGTWWDGADGMRKRKGKEKIQGLGKKPLKKVFLLRGILHPIVLLFLNCTPHDETSITKGW